MFPDRYRVPVDGSFRLNEATSSPPADAPGKKTLNMQLDSSVREIAELQRVLYADDRHSLLLVFQAMDAAGKDSTIRHVLSGVNPAGCQVHSFKKPSSEELDHDFLWRTAKSLPQRGRIGVFNRSYYEEVLVIRVHPEWLGGQRIPNMPDLNELWDQRYRSINAHERHLADNGTVILKFWLNVSKEEQRNRFLSRLDEPHKNWKFNTGDVDERGRWNDYMSAYEAALRATSTPWAPWYAIPADDKNYMRSVVAETIESTLRGLDIAWPTVDDKARASFDEMRNRLLSEP